MKLTHLFRVENLDTRFIPPSSPSPLPHTQPSRWNTYEYYLYYLVFLTIPPLMFKSVYGVSQPAHPNYPNFEHLLEPGWIPGRLVDNSDAQYRGFRGNVVYMGVLLVVHPLLRRVWERVGGGGVGGGGPLQPNGSVSKRGGESAGADAEERLMNRTTFDLAFGLIFLLALHGISAFKVLLILYINFQIGTKLSKPYVGVATWVFNIAILFANELCRGYSFATISSLILPPTTTNAGEKGGMEGSWGQWIDSYGGLIPRWEVLFNFTVLRLIAFNFDYQWMLERRESSPVEVRPSQRPPLPSPRPENT